MNVGGKLRWLIGARQCLARTVVTHRSLKFLSHL